MMDSAEFTSTGATEERRKSPEERILEAIFGPMPTLPGAGQAAVVTPQSIDKDFEKVLTSLDRSEARMRVLQDQLWTNRREIDAGLERIRAANDLNETALKSLAGDE